jgi:hypothetical protein
MRAKHFNNPSTISIILIISLLVTLPGTFAVLLTTVLLLPFSLQHASNFSPPEANKMAKDDDEEKAEAPLSLCTDWISDGVRDVVVTISGSADIL